MTRESTLIAAALVCVPMLAGCDSREKQAVEPIEVRDFPIAGPASGGAQAGAEDHEGEGEPGAEGVELSPEQLESIGLSMQPAAPAVLALDSAFPGEVILVPDRVTHVMPQAPGIVRETLKTIGDRVEAGEILACLDSSELAEAKLAFFSAVAEIGCCQIELPRARAIHSNVSALLQVFDEGATPEAIAELDGKEMGEWRGILLGAQADLEAASAARKREEALRQRKVTSETALVEATAAYARSRAHLDAKRDTARYTTLRTFSEEARKRQVAELGLVTAEGRLRVLGVQDDWIDRLSALVPKMSSFEPCTCDDPECTDGEIPSIEEALKGEQDLGRYCLRAQQDGIITEKHLSLGERLSGGESVFVIVNADRVWVRFNVYQKDLGLIREDARVVISMQGTTATYEGAITYISPVVDEKTRTVTARVELGNLDGSLRPGLFVSVSVADPGGEAAVTVPLAAVQIIEESEVVFVKEHDAFVPVSVRTGRSDGVRVEVLDGLEAGTPVVVDGAFDIKAKLVTAGLGSHAGHGH